MDAMFPRSVDVVVVGARVAGAATAMLLARAGRSVLMIDRGEYGSDILSTHALMRGGVLQLARWNLLERIVDAGTPPVTATTFHLGSETLRVAIKPKFGVHALYAPHHPRSRARRCRQRGRRRRALRHAPHRADPCGRRPR
jgi:2-polyprenyl-6-methoxyphenol hydroxylase-like FAD-dependent oxidoreductase